MIWDEILIVDQSGRSYNGEAAQKYAEANCPPGKVKTSKWGNISIEFSAGIWSYKTQIIRHTLWGFLKDKIQTLKDLEVAYGTREPFIPRRKTNNLLNIKPEYIIEFQLGDIDALFDPIKSDVAPWKQESVRQRMQVLGYLYTPLKHSKIEEHAAKCWDYYRQVHEKKQNGKLNDPQLLELLRKEIGNNILAPSLPKSGEVFENSTLPEMGKFAALRFPGAYCLNYPRPGLKDDWDGDVAKDTRKPVNRPNDADAKYDFSVLDDTYKAENALVEDNPLLGKIPLIATVHKRLLNGETEPASGVYVYFQLVEPGTLLPNDVLRAPEPRNTVMDYGLDPGAFDAWQKAPAKRLQGEEFSQDEWDQAKSLANEYFREAEKDCRDDVQRLKQEALEADKKVKIASDKYGSKTRAFNVTQAKYKDEQAKALGELDRRFNAAKEEAAQKEKVYEDISGELKKMKDFVQPKPPSNLKIVRKNPKTESEIAADQKRAEEQTAKKVAYQKEIPNKERELIDAEKEKNIAGEKARALETEFQEAEKKAAEKNSYRNELDTAFSEMEKAGTEKREAEEEAAGKRDLAKKIIEQRCEKLIQERLPIATPDKVKAALRVIVETAKNNKDLTGPMYRFLLANRGNEPIKFPHEIPNAGPKRFVDDVLARVEKNAQPNDPQRRNAPKQYNGKAGEPVAGSIFEVTARSHFNDGHPKYGVLPVAEVAANENHSVKAKTNEQGHAGVIFMPSKCGGDTYRLRVFVGPESLGKSVESPSIITGGMVVWRNLRIYRYLQKPPINPDNYSADVKALIEWPANPDNKVEKYTGAKSWPEAIERMFLDTPLVKIDFGEGWTKEPTYQKTDPFKGEGGYRPVNVDFISFTQSFNQCYCEVIMDTNEVEVLEPGLQLKAIRQGLIVAEEANQKAMKEAEAVFISAERDMKKAEDEYLQAKDKSETIAKKLENEQTAEADRAKKEAVKETAAAKAKFDKLKEEYDAKQKALCKRIDWDTLLFHDPQSPFLLNLRHYAHYNKLTEHQRNKFPALTGEDDPKINSALDPAMINEMLRVFADGGVYPGLTLVQVQRGDSWDQHAISAKPTFSSGIAAPSRAAFIFYTEGAHRSDKFGYSATCNAVHELGHVLMGEHQDTNPGGDRHKHQPQPKMRTTPRADEVACVMGYMGGYGEFCGRCLLRLRGWKTKSILTADGV